MLGSCTNSDNYKAFSWLLWL